MIEYYLTTRDVANKFNCSQENILYLCTHGKFSGAVKVGHMWLIPRESVENYKPALKGFSAMWEKRKQGKKKESGELSAYDIRGIIEKSAKNGGVIEADQEGGRE